MFNDNREDRQFEWTEDGHTSVATYYEHGGVVSIPHVETPVEARGNGAAGRLMEAVAKHARKEGLRLRPTCPYAAVWFRRHPNDQDVLA